MMMKNGLPILLLLLGLMAGSLAGPLSQPLHAASPLPIPVVVAESDDFEIVGRLEDQSLVFFVDRHSSNAPVLAARLEIEQGEHKAVARFRPETGDYLIDDAAFLAVFAKPGEYPLSFTLIAGEESDLLSAHFAVNLPSTVTNGLATPGGDGQVNSALLLLLVAAGWWFFKARKGGAA
jgi:hypothetical protein